MELFVFDESYKGLLTAIFDYYDRKAKSVQLITTSNFQPSLIQTEHQVITEEAKAKRVWAGLQRKLDKDSLRKFYYAWHAEDGKTFQNLFAFALYIFDNAEGAYTNYGNDYVLAVSQIARKVHREKHRMEAFIRFQETQDGIFFAHVDPDFNVLPLIINHFKNRYADQQWIIYDSRRKYGLYFDKVKVTEITFEFSQDLSSTNAALSANLVDEKEELYSILWKDYFKSTNIVARKNMKLHIMHVPKRYWRYLTEKW